MAKKSSSNRTNAKKANNDKYSESEESTTSVGYLIWIIPIIAIGILGWIIYLWFNVDPEEQILGATLADWKIGSIFILMILIVILILVHPSGKMSSRPEGSKRSKMTKPTPSESKPTKMVVIEALEPETVAEAQLTEDIVKAQKAEDEDEIADAEIIAPPAKNVSPNMIEYPKKVEGGIYGDTFITIDEGETLKLRSLVVEDVYLV